MTDQIERQWTANGFHYWGLRPDQGRLRQVGAARRNMMREQVPAKLDWRWREHRDGDIGRARFKCFDLKIQDCDGDYAEWQIRRGEVYIAMGEERDLDAAEAKVMEVLPLLWRAVEMNDFVANELPKLRAQGVIR